MSEEEGEREVEEVDEVGRWEQEEKRCQGREVVVGKVTRSDAEAVER